MRDLHTAADAVGATRPAGVDQPDPGAARGDAIAEEPRVGGRVVHHERCAETGAERRLRFGDPLLGSRHLGGVAGKEVVHRAGRRQPRDGRQHAEGVAGQHHDIRRVAAAPRFDPVVDERDRVRAARVLRNRIVVEIQGPARRVHHHVLEHGPEPARRAVDLRFRLLRQVDHLRVATTFEVEDAVVAPPMLVVADQAAVRVRGQRRLAGAGEAEEERRVAAGADVGRAVHRHDAPGRQQVVHHREDRFLDLAGIAGAADQHGAAGEVEQDERAGIRAVARGIGGHRRNVDDRELRLVPAGRGAGRLFEEHRPGEEAVPGPLGHDANRQPVVGIRAGEAVLHVERPAVERRHRLLVERVEHRPVDRPVDGSPPDVVLRRRLPHEELVVG